MSSTTAISGGSERMPELRSRRRRRHRRAPIIDAGLLVAALCLLGIGFLMVTSASMPMADRNYEDPFFFVLRHGVALALALVCGALCFAVPPRLWQRFASLMLVLGIGLLLVLLVPGVGREVNGATRWIPLGVFNLQPSELMKFIAVIFVSGYLVRNQLEIQSTMLGFVRPLLPVGVACALIMVQPDFGTTAVVLATVMGLLFLGGVSVFSFFALFTAVAVALAVLIISEPYRMERMASFRDPFADPFNSGYQLTQALIALGRGEWFGVGLGNGIQKQLYLPEAHTDFLLAVFGEEFGLVGVMVVIALFAFVTWRAFAIGAEAQRRNAMFACYVAHGFGLLIGMQAFINIGVNTGMLPTKGLPLPFMSYGSNALIVTVMSVAVLLRIDFELRRTAVEPIPEGGFHRERPIPPSRPLRERGGRDRGATWRRHSR
jgi:cell division protein FtsW